MLAGNLLKDQQFRIVGWDKAIVLTVLIPFRPQATQDFTLLAHRGGQVESVGSVVLAGAGKPIGDLRQKLFAVPITVWVALL